MGGHKLTKKIGENIRHIRMHKDIGQRRLARESGISLTLIGRLELGKHRNVSVVTLEKIAKVLNVAVVKLFE